MKFEEKSSQKVPEKTPYRLCSSGIVSIPDIDGVAALNHVSELSLISRSRAELVADWLISLVPGTLGIRHNSMLVWRRNLLVHSTTFHRANIRYNNNTTYKVSEKNGTTLFLWSPYVIGQTIIFLTCDFSSFFFLFFLH